MGQQFFYQPFLNALVFFYSYIPFEKLGLAIIFVTLAIRLILFPLTLSSLKYQENMKKMQPEIDKIKKKYAKDKQKLQEAQMKLFSENKINPITGCLPILIQLPILLALYSVFKAFNADNIQTINDVLYSFVPKLTTIEPNFLGIDLTVPDKLYILPVLAGATQFIQSKMMLPKSDDPSQKAMQQVTYFMPIILIVFSVSLPAALPLYWTVGALFAIVQTYLMRKNKNGS
ncbi:MAG: YidC/Oxa1 family membrane protein insertase [bacterium]